MPVAWTLPAAGRAVLTVLALGAGLFVLLWARPTVFKTTLTSAWWWSLAALCFWSAVELLAAAANLGGGAVNSLRFGAVTLSLCPVIALLGAKRPQHVAWNFVVLALWSVLFLPAAEAYFLRGSSTVSIGTIRAAFLCLLVLLGPINFVPTRFWLPCLVLAGGQLIALLPHFGSASGSRSLDTSLVGLLFVSTSLALAWSISSRTSLAASHFDGLWLDFRDRFGLLWGLRVQERVNAAAKQYGWDVELTWSGFQRLGDNERLVGVNAAIAPQLGATFAGLLRRFETSAQPYGTYPGQ